MRQCTKYEEILPGSRRTAGIYFVQYLESRQGKGKGKRESELFYTSAINGKITNVSANVGAVYFKVENSEEKYMFIPRPVSGNQKEWFSAFATRGDSISKPAHATYLKLYKEGKVYTYSFRILHEDTTLSK